MKRVRYKNMAKIDADRVKATIDVPTIAGLRNRLRSSMGSLCRHSATTNTTSKTAEPINPPTIWTLPQPAALPRTSANTSKKSAVENDTNPIQSMRRSLCSLEASTRANVIAMATMPTGTLTKKIQRQPNPLVIAPPMSGPTATAPPMTAP